jgi:hypothetical protein
MGHLPQVVSCSRLYQLSVGQQLLPPLSACAAGMSRIFHYYLYICSDQPCRAFFAMFSTLETLVVGSNKAA